MKKVTFFIGPFLLLFIWYVVTKFNLVNRLLLPDPKSTFSTLWELLITGDLSPDINATAQRWLYGYILGCIIGIPVGIVMGISRMVYESLEFLIDFFRSLPVTALFPLFLLVFGIGDSSKVAMVFTATVFIVILNSAYGVIQTKKGRIKLAKIFGATKWQIFRHVVLFEALPHTVIGMRIALSLSIVVVIVSEMFIGTRFGLGQRVFDTYTRNSLGELYGVLILIGLIGYAMNKVFVILESKIVFWAGK